jgi:hypothetical protein
MIEYVVGNYLVSIGRMTEEQFVQMFDRQDKIHVKLGMIAVSEGYMTKAEADGINNSQMSVDEKFGDIAVKKGLLTDLQLSSLLRLQGNSYHAFIQTLTDMGIIGIEEADDIVRKAKNRLGLSAEDVEAIKNNDVDRILPIFMPDASSEMKEIVGVLLRTIIRCADRHVFLEAPVFSDSVAVTDGALQSVDGEYSYTSAIEEDNGGLIKIACAYAKENFTEVDDDVLDAAGEFLNCVNGIFASRMSMKNIPLEIKPQTYAKNTEKLFGKQVLSLPVYIRGKKLKFIILV